MAKHPGMSVRLRGKLWRMARSKNLKARGDIDSAEVKSRRIRIASRVEDNTEELLEVVIHECLHGLFWDMGEEAIHQAGVDLARLLTRLGAKISLEELPTTNEKG